MGGGPMAVLGVSLDNVMLQQAALNVQQNLANQTSAAFNHQMAMAQAQAYRNQQSAMTPNQMFGSMIGAARAEPLSKPQPSVASTAASRVQKAEWELEYDRKDREVDEMIERQRQERERVRIEEENGNDRYED